MMKCFRGVYCVVWWSIVNQQSASKASPLWVKEQRPARNQEWSFPLINHK
jgi:hypothetical protein